MHWKKISVRGMWTGLLPTGATGLRGLSVDIGPEVEKYFHQRWRN